MRITTQMMMQASRESGLPLVQSSLLDALSKKQGGSNSLFDALNHSKNDVQQVSEKQQGYQKLEAAAEDLALSSAALFADGEDTLFAKAEESGSTEDILQAVQTMVESYNKALKLLKDADGSLNAFYRKELIGAAGDNAELLDTVGITQNKDGSLTVDTKKLESADLETLKKVFGSEADFTDITSYIGLKVAENAAANAPSITSQYNAKGMAYNDNFESTKYDYFS